jgi:hypothetical protein
MIFDDSFPHEAWNETDEIRVVLFIDFVRPLRFPMNIVNQLVIKIIALTPFVKDANRNQKYWDERLEQVMSQKAKQKQLEKVLTSKSVQPLTVSFVVGAGSELSDLFPETTSVNPPPSEVVRSCRGGLITVYSEQ